MVEERQDDDSYTRGEQDSQGRFVLEGPTNAKAFALLVECVRQGGNLPQADMARRIQELDLEARIEACRYVDYYLLPGRSKMQLTKELLASLVCEVPPAEVLDLGQLGLCRSEMIMDRIHLVGLRIKNLRLENSHVKKIEVHRCDLLDCDFSFTVTAGEVKVSSSRLENVQFGVFTMMASVEESQLVQCNLRVAEELFVADSELDTCTFKGSDEDRKDRQFISAIFNNSDLHGVDKQRGQKCIHGVLDLHLDRSCASPDAINSHRQMCFWFAEIEEVALAAELAMVALGKMSSGAQKPTPPDFTTKRIDLPIMPLPAVYLPSPSQQLMISEPRYLQLYDDILLNGSRIFVVTHHHGNLLAKVGLIFHLKELKDVSADTHGHFKYVAEHEVRGRVRIISVANPEDWTEPSRYLKAQVQLMDQELDQDDASPPSEQDASNALGRIRHKLQEALALQGELEQQKPEELGRLARSLRLASVIRNPGFWDMCSMLASVQSFRLQLNVRRLRENVKRLTAQWAEQNPEEYEALKVQPEVLPARIRREGKQVGELLREGTAQLQGTFQCILQAPDAEERADLLENADITLPFDRVVCERTYFHGRLLRMTKGGSTISLRRAKLRTLPRIECEGKIILCLEDCDLLESLTFHGMRLQLRGVHCAKPCEFQEVEFATKVCDIVFPRSSRFVNVRFKDGLQACVASACRFEYCNLGYGQDAVADCLLTQCHFQSCHFPFLEDCSPVANFAGSQFIACRIQWSGPFAHEESFVINSHWLRKWNLASCTVSDGVEATVDAKPALDSSLNALPAVTGGKTDKERHYSIKLVKPGSGGLKLGLDVDYMAERSVLPIMSVTGGVAEKWNQDNPEMQIRKGDSIVEVNGTTGDVAQMLDKCKTDVELESHEGILVVSRAMATVFARFWASVFLVSLAAAGPRGALERFPPQVLHATSFVDNFDFTTNGTFQQRILMYRDWWTTGKPVLLFFGGEGSVEGFYNATGAIFEHAVALNAMVVFVEHRCYGKSLPEVPLSRCLRRLTVEQALADVAWYIVKLREQLNCKRKECAFITLGGSYGGMLVAWFQQKYPHLSAGGIASSAPIDFYPHDGRQDAFWSATLHTFETFGSRACAHELNNSLQLLRSTSDSPQGRRRLGELLGSCDPLLEEVTAGSKVDFFVRGAVSTLAMLDYPVASDFVTKLPANPVKVACQRLAGTGNPLEGLKAVLDLFLNATGTYRCYDFLAEMVGRPTNGTLHGPSTPPDMGPWQYQACNELPMQSLTTDGMGFYPAADGQLSEVSDSCNLRYGIRPRTSWLQVNFGGSDLHVGHLLFTNGEKDPWRVGAPKPERIGEALDIHQHLIPGAAHHEDLRFDAAPPRPLVSLAKQKARALMQRWIADFQRKATAEQLLTLCRCLNYDHLVADLEKLISAKNCGPIMIRLSWHDAGVFNGADGCPNAAMRLAGSGEHSLGANAGLPEVALALLGPITEKYVPRLISHADLWALAANVSIKAMGGPEIPTRFGRLDAHHASDGVSSADGRLPDGDKDANHIRGIFGPKGFEDRDMVALSGAHTVGMCHGDRSGFEGPWTDDKLLFDNSYFKDLLQKPWTKETNRHGKPQYRSGETMMLTTDMALVEDPAFKQHVERYAADQKSWFDDFAKAWVRLQEFNSGELRDIL
ncbi:PRCP [Symbiodinium sp. KB8]|nr:PRCP [Symbiodinium sp. KB8]